MSFSNEVIIYTEALVTLHGCALHNDVDFFMCKSQHEPDFTYNTAEMIPSVINNKTINIISTSVHYYLHMYLLLGIRTVNILRSDFISDLHRLYVVAGNKSVESVNSRHLTVLNISIINTTFTNFDMFYWPSDINSMIFMKTIHSTFNGSSIRQDKGGYFGVTFENSKFHELYS